MKPEKSFFAIIFLLFTATIFFVSPAHASVADTSFFRMFGGINFEEFNDIANVPDSGFILVGKTNGYGAGSNSVYVVRTGRDGSHIWSRVIGGGAPDVAYAICPYTNGNYLIAGTSSSAGNGGYDGYLAKMDTSGNLLSENYYGGSDWDFIYAVNTLPDNTILLAGESYSSSNGGSDAWVLAADSAGNTLWSQHFGGAGNDRFKNITVFENEIYLSGMMDSTDVSGKDGLIVKLDLAGNLIWQKQYDYLGNDFFNGIAVIPSGKLIAYGGGAVFSSPANDLWIEEYDTSGTSLWRIASSNGEDDYVNKIISLKNDSFVVVGEKNPGGNGGKSLYAALFDNSGFYVSSNSLGGPNDDEGYGGVRSLSGGLAFCGYTNSYGSGNDDGLLIIQRYDSVVDGANNVYNSLPFVETLSPIGINKITLASAEIFPNPFVNRISVGLPDNELITQITITDIAGKLSFSKTVNREQKIILDLSFLKKGNYNVVLYGSDNTVYSGRLVKE